MRILYLLLPFTFLVLSCSKEKKEQFDVVIQNGSILNLETGELLNQDIYILNGRINKIAFSNKEFHFEAKQTLDASGKYILPGFWDNHVHFRGGDNLIKANKNFLKLFIANGVTTVRDAGGDLTTAVLEWRKAISAGDLVGPTIFTSGPKIDGTNPTWAGSLEVETEADVQIALDSLQRIPTDFVKLYESRLSRENYLAVIREAEKRNLITSGHMPFTVTLDETITSGIDAIEHLYYIMKGCSANEVAITERLQKKEIGFWDAMPLLQQSYQDDTAQNIFTKLKENNVFVVPTLHIGKTLSYLDEVDHGNDDYLKYMGNGIIETYQGRINRLKNTSEKAVADRKALDSFFGKLTKSLYEADVQLLAGSDSGAYNSYTYPGISLHKELEEMVANGLPPLKALRTSAINGSKFLKQDDYGSVTEGKKADVVLLDANPLEDIKNTQKIDAVLKEGILYSKKDLKALLNSAQQ